MEKFLLSAFCKDRVGVVADISQVIYENGYNLEDSSMTYLAGEFAILLELSTNSNVDKDEALNVLTQECRRLEREKQITAFVRPIETATPVTTGKSIKKTIFVEGVDQAGIVFELSKYLAEAGINILSLKSATRMSPESGSSLYEMTMVVEIPTSFDLGEVENQLAEIGDGLHVDVAIND